MNYETIIIVKKYYKKICTNQSINITRENKFSIISVKE